MRLREGMAPLSEPSTSPACLESPRLPPPCVRLTRAHPPPYVRSRAPAARCAVPRSIQNSSRLRAWPPEPPRHGPSSRAAHLTPTDAFKRGQRLQRTAQAQEVERPRPREPQFLRRIGVDGGITQLAIEAPAEDLREPQHGAALGSLEFFERCAQTGVDLMSGKARVESDRRTNMRIVNSDRHDKSLRGRGETGEVSEQGGVSSGAINTST